MQERHADVSNYLKVILLVIAVASSVAAAPPGAVAVPQLKYPSLAPMVSESSGESSLDQFASDDSSPDARCGEFPAYKPEQLALCPHRGRNSANAKPGAEN